MIMGRLILVWVSLVKPIIQSDPRKHIPLVLLSTPAENNKDPAT